MLYLFTRWQKLQECMPLRNERSNGSTRLLVVPCDPWSVFGSRGDEAMINATIDHMSTLHPDLEIGVITAESLGTHAVRERGFTPFEVWCGRDYLDQIAQTIVDFDPDYGIVLGADVMDGYYAPLMSVSLLAAADLMSRHHVKTSLLGFSFNNQPHVSMIRGFRIASKELVIHVRDPLSLARFEAFTGRKAVQVADAAFLMQGMSDFEEFESVRTWTNQRRLTGEAVLGVNLHPMLIPHATDDVIAEHCQIIATVMKKLLADHSVSLLLLPHDYRDRVGDRYSLDPLAELLIEHYPSRVRYVRTEYSARQLKAIVGLADGLLSARMHLAIAALSKGVPVCAFIYQDKFHGLFRLFDFPEQYLFSPPTYSAEQQLYKAIVEFVGELPVLRERVSGKLAEVQRLAQSNLEWS